MEESGRDGTKLSQSQESPKWESQNCGPILVYVKWITRFLDSVRRPCQHISCNHKAWDFGDLMGTAKINSKYLCNCQRWQGKGCLSFFFLYSTNSGSLVKERGSGSRVLLVLFYKHTTFILIEYSTHNTIWMFRWRHLKKKLFPVAHWLRGCALEVCVLCLKAKALLVVIKVTFKNNYPSTKELQRKYEWSYQSPFKSGLELQ